MKIRTIFKLFALLLVTYSNAQNYQTQKTVVDLLTKLPLENVIISNQKDYSTTNAEGKFIFVSANKAINLNFLGYETIATTFDELKESKDTIFMQQKTIQLPEIIVGNSAAYIQKVYDKIKDNELGNYTIDFFLRNILKKEDEPMVLQDLSGKRNKDNSAKNKTSIEILNMRKVKLYDKKEGIDFKFQNFEEISNLVAPSPSGCNFTEIAFNDENYKKIEFESKNKNNQGLGIKGYLVINKKDLAIVELKMSSDIDTTLLPYSKFMLSKVKYRTPEWTKHIKFIKDVASNKYYPVSLKMDVKVEVATDKKSFFFNNSIDFFVTSAPRDEKITPNFSTDKDLFKAKFIYSADFWKNQNQLPLTKELDTFLKLVADKKDKTKEYEVMGNF
ncbi:MAG: hypothetical protein ACOVKP_03090 [Flavobacterium sp.]